MSIDVVINVILLFITVFLTVWMLVKTGKAIHLFMGPTFTRKQKAGILYAMSFAINVVMNTFAGLVVSATGNYYGNSDLKLTGLLMLFTGFFTLVGMFVLGIFVINFNHERTEIPTESPTP